MDNVAYWVVGEIDETSKKTETEKSKLSIIHPSFLLCYLTEMRNEFSQ